MNDARYKTYWQHYIFGKDQDFCRECFQTPPKETKQVRVVNGNGKGQNIRVGKANGMTVCYYVDTLLKEALRTIAVCGVEDQFSRKKGRGQCASRAIDKEGVALKFSTADDLGKKELEELFNAVAPIEIW